MRQPLEGFLDCREDDGDFLCMECDRYVRLEGHKADCPQQRDDPLRRRLTAEGEVDDNSGGSPEAKPIPF